MTRIRSRVTACVVIAFLLCHASALRAADTLDSASRFAALARVWGLLKYFLPLVAQGTLNWDSVLVYEVPAIAAAETKIAFNDEIVRLIRLAGQAPRVSPGRRSSSPSPIPRSDGLTIRNCSTRRRSASSGGAG